MAQVVIEHFGQLPRYDDEPLPAVRRSPYVPYFSAQIDGQAVLRVGVQMTFEAQIDATAALHRSGIWRGNPAALLDRALMKYGMRRVEQAVIEMLAAGPTLQPASQTWKVWPHEVDDLLALIEDKSCSYQVRDRRDLFCTAAAPGDKTPRVEIGGRLSAPTSRPLCRSCELPSNDLLCSHLLHPMVTNDTSQPDGPKRTVVTALCDRGRDEINEPGLCHAGGHKCWQQVVEIEDPRPPTVAPLALPEAFDVLDAVWRLAFGRKRRLLKIGTTVGPAALVLDCDNRAEFQTRLSALADLIDLITVDEDLLPAGLTDQQKDGSINRLSECLLAKLPSEHHSQINRAIQTLRLVRQARNAMQHSKVDGGLTPKLRALGIHDAPPNWHDAWDTIRAHMAEALGVIRHELRRWVDVQPN